MRSRPAGDIAGALAAERGRLAFGVPGGGANLDLVGALHDAGVEFVLTHTETAGAIMASAAAEVSGAPSLCLATRGPGAASMANGVAHAWLDRTPVLAVTDGIPLADRSRVSHQRLDQHRLFSACAKASVEIGIANGAALAREAVRCAAAPPWGPVHLDTIHDATGPGRLPGPPVASGPSLLETLRARLARARRPVVIAGVGARHAEDAVGELVAALGAPLLTTYKAKGLLPDDSPSSAGLFTGATIERPLLDAADLLLMIGVDPVELIPAGWSHDAAVVALSPWPTVDRYFVPEVEVVGDVRELAGLLAARARPAAWERQGRDFRAEALAAIAWTGPHEALTTHEVVASVQDAAPGAVATVDAGAHMLVVMPLWHASGPRSTLISSGLATMGFALPAAIGASLAQGRCRVVCFTGDGGIGMCLQELETLARLSLPVTVIVLNDRLLSLVHVKQRPEGHGGLAAVRYRATDFAACARAQGLRAERVDSPASLSRALDAASESGGPFLIDAVIDPTPYGHVLEAVRGRSRSARARVDQGRHA